MYSAGQYHCYRCFKEGETETPGDSVTLLVQPVVSGRSADETLAVGLTLGPMPLIAIPGCQRQGG